MTDTLQQPETLTLDAIKRDKWNAVDLALPAAASRELLAATFYAAEACVFEAFAAVDYDLEGGPAVAAARALPRFAAYETIDQHKDDHKAAIGRLHEAVDRGFTPPEGHPFADHDARLKSGEAILLAEERAANPREEFAPASLAVLRTPQDHANRDLAVVSGELAKTAQVLGTPEHAEFQKAQAERGEKISRTADPAERAVLRQERDAAAHTYAAGLADKVAVIAELGGSRDSADQMRQLAGLHREIADELTSGGKTPPEGPTPRDPASPDRDAGAEFVEAAKAVGQGALGRSAEVVMVAEGPAEGPLHPNDRLRQAENTANMAPFRVPTPSGDAIVTGQVHQSRADAAPARAGDLSPLVVGQVDEPSLARVRADSGRQQAADELALHPSSGQAAMDRLAARLSGDRSAMQREGGEDRAQEESPDRPGKDAQRGPGFYAALTR